MVRTVPPCRRGTGVGSNEGAANEGGGLNWGEATAARAHPGSALDAAASRFPGKASDEMMIDGIRTRGRR